MEQWGDGDVRHRSQSLIILGGQGEGRERTTRTSQGGEVTVPAAVEEQSPSQCSLVQGTIHSKLSRGSAKRRGCPSFAGRCSPCLFWEEALPAHCWQANNCKRHLHAPYSRARCVP